MPGPQSLVSLHVRSPLVGHSGADGSTGPGDSPALQASTRPATATTVTEDDHARIFDNPNDGPNGSKWSTNRG
jgi:hypothetical protein